MNKLYWFLKYIKLAVVLFIIIKFTIIIGRMKRKAEKRFGPDIIHLGLLLLILFSVYTLFYRQETTVYLSEGEEVEVWENYVLQLNRLEFLTSERIRTRPVQVTL